MPKKSKKNNQYIEQSTETNFDMEIIEQNEETIGDDMEEITAYDEGKKVVDIQDESNKNKVATQMPDLGVNEIIYINRDQEDADVVKFQQTGDLRLLEKVYKNRVPTLKTWAYQHFYPGLTPSIEDLFEELAVVFLKAANRYERKRGAFNTCLFTFLLNRLKNLKNSKYAKKRISEEYEGPLNGMILSLDFVYNDSDGTEITLKDIIASKNSISEDSIHKDSSLAEAVKLLAKGNPLIHEFLIKLSEGNSVAALLKEYRTKNGTLQINKSQASRISKRFCKNIVKKMIEGNIPEKNFTVVDYKVNPDNSLKYSIELKKTEESDQILRSLRELKRNKDFYMKLLRGKE